MKNFQNQSFHVEPETTCNLQSAEATLHAGEIQHERMNGDPGLLINEKLSQHQRNRIILKRPNQPKQSELPGKEFPKTMSGSHHKSFNESWYFAQIGKEKFRRKWLSYSPAKDAIFCHHCIFFGKAKRQPLLN